MPGPQCSACIVFPTEPVSDRGEPHAVEHLVFMGSAITPFKGYLDLLASRCVTPGTNAYTAEDHTCFSVECASSDGLLHILPAYLEHLLHPQINDSTLTTEIYHVDDKGAEAGVVFCEILSRENSEHDICETKVHELLFPGSAYALNSGGSTKNIRSLTVEHLVCFHSKFYHPRNMTVILLGSVNHNAMLQRLLSAKINPEQFATQFDPPWLQPIPALTEDCSSTVRFPTSDDSVGSLVLAFRGPPFWEIETCVALEILFRALSETASSPFQKYFVESKCPLAAGVDIDILYFKETAIDLTFTGIDATVALSELKERKEETDSENDDVNSEENEIPESSPQDLSEKSESDISGNEESASQSSDDGDCTGSDIKGETTEEEHGNLLVPGKLLFEVKRLLHNLFFAPSDKMSLSVIHCAIARHKVKLLEDLEDEPHSTVSECLVVESTLKPTGTGKIGDHLQCILPALSSLEEKPFIYWATIVKKWILDAPCVEVIAIPDVSLSKRTHKANSVLLSKRCSDLGSDGLAGCHRKLEEAIARNNQPIPPSLQMSLPTVPSALSIPLASVRNFVAHPEGFFPLQILELRTHFYHVRLCFDISHLPDRLRPYLVLFQELLFCSPVREMPTGHIITYETVVAHLAEAFVSVECGVGLGNSLFDCQPPSHLVSISATIERSKFLNSCGWLPRILANAIFTQARLVSLIPQLISDLTDSLRDGSTVCDNLLSHAGGLANRKHGACDADISLFSQFVLLKKIKKSIDSNPNCSLNDVISALCEIQKFLLADDSRIFGQIAVPPEEHASVLGQFISCWKPEIKSRTRKRKRPSHPNFMLPYCHPATQSLPPFSLLIPIKGVDTSFFSQSVSCSITVRHPDYFPVCLLNEILSRTEGPLYSKIRGAGYAYDASISLQLTSQQLVFVVQDSTSPHQAVQEFYEVLRCMNSTPETYLSEFAIESARSALLYQFHSTQFTAPSLITASLRSLLKGFPSLAEETANWQLMDKVHQSDILRVFHLYFTQFLRSEHRTTVVVTDPSAVENLLSEFGGSTTNPTNFTVHKYETVALHNNIFGL
ncbi:cytoplasmic protein [Pelomyxa schiedti]|nr:cytoplasmic protein [Pelomyxa schiedti]